MQPSPPAPSDPPPGMRPCPVCNATGIGDDGSEGTCSVCNGEKFIRI